MAKIVNTVPQHGRTGNPSVQFYNDPVDNVLAYLEVIKTNGLSLSAKNDVYSKLANSVNIQNGGDALAMLRGFAQIKNLDPAIANRLCERVTEACGRQEILTAVATSVKNANLLRAAYPQLFGKRM